MAKLALVFTVVVAEKTLFAVFGSAASLFTSALLTMIVPAGTLAFTLTTTVIVAGGPEDSDPRLQAKGLLGSPGTTPLRHTPWLGVALTKVACPDRTSVTTTLGATDGPALLTLIVYVRLVPAVTEAAAVF